MEVELYRRRELFVREKECLSKVEEILKRVEMKEQLQDEWK